MKKALSIMIMFLVVFTITGCGKQKNVNKITDNINDLANKVMNKAKVDDTDKEYGLSKIDLTTNEINKDNLNDILGITEDEYQKNIEEAIEIKPNDTWSPESYVFIKVKDKVNVSKLAERIVKNTVPTRFGCLRPDVIVGAYYSNIIVLIDSSKDTSEVVLNSFEKIMQNKITEITRENDWTFSMDDIIDDGE